MILRSITKEILCYPPQSIAALHDVARVAILGGSIGLALVLPACKPRQRYNARQTVQVDTMVNARCARDLGVAIARELMQVNLVRIQSASP